MIRSRDFILFVLILFFLGVAIFVTLAKNNIITKSDNMSPDVIWKNSGDVELSAFSVDGGADRSVVIDRLRTKLSEGRQNIIVSPSVETRSEEGERDEGEGVGLLSRCATEDDSLTFSRNWPLENISVTIREGARIISQVTVSETVTEVASTTASTTSLTTVRGDLEKVLLQLPITPVQLEEPTCVPSEIVGVSVKGSLLFNGDVILYRTYGTDDLIGYARDGFPIYGPHDGMLDECGGYESSNGYRYAASIDRPYFLGCFKAEVQPFANQ